VIRARPVALAAVSWLVGAGTAVAVGLLALSFVGSGLVAGANDPLASAVDAPSAPPSATAEPTPSSRPSPSASASGSATATASPVERSLANGGGTVVARCVGDQVYLVGWSPAQGFHTDDVRRGPATYASVEFENVTQEIKLRVTCIDGVPQALG